MDDNSKIVPEYLSRLIEGCSRNSRIAIQFWLLLAFFSIAALSPTKSDQGRYTMIFELGKFTERDFYSFSFVCIAILIIAFGSATMQAIRARQLIQRAIDSQENKIIFPGNIYLQDLVDAIIYPALNRVAPLAQILQGKNQFFPESYKVSKVNKRFAYGLYVILKVIMTTVMYLLPGYAFVLSFINCYKQDEQIWNLPFFFFWLLVIFSGLVFVIMLFKDLSFVKGVYKRIMAMQSEDQNR